MLIALFMMTPREEAIRQDTVVTNHCYLIKLSTAIFMEKQYVEHLWVKRFDQFLSGEEVEFNPNTV